MIEGKTKSGFKFAIDERIGNDWRVIQSIALAESKNTSEQVKGTTELVDLILGSNKDKFMEHIAKRNDGYIPIDEVVNELAEIITSSKETKNS